MEVKVIIRERLNLPPEKEIAEAIAQFGEGWRVVTANTCVAMNPDPIWPHRYNALYVTTVVLQKEGV